MQHKTTRIYSNLLTGFVILFAALMFSSARAADGERQFLPLQQKSTLRSLHAPQQAPRYMPLRNARVQAQNKMMAINGAAPAQGWRLSDLRNAPRTPKTDELSTEMKVAMANAQVPYAASKTDSRYAEMARESIAAALASHEVLAPPQEENIDTDIEDVHEALAASLPDGMREAIDTAIDYVWPVADAHHGISSPFGYRKHPITGKRSFHAGIDIPAPTGTDVLAAAAGEVTGVGEHPRLGRYVKVSHADGSYSLYGHLQRWTARIGDKVASGEVIGKVGSTGRSTGPHLDFSIRRDGKPFNPMRVLAQAREQKKLAFNK